jgi:hypothetical protein
MTLSLWTCIWQALANSYRAPRLLGNYALGAASHLYVSFYLGMESQNEHCFVLALTSFVLVCQCAGGLSANDMETQFYEAGADDYVMKPFPCRVDPLKHELLRIMSKKSSLFSRIFASETSDDCDETDVTSSTPSSS